MSGAGSVEKILQTCSYRCGEVVCPHQQASAHVIAARWKLSNGRWRPWTVVDCPLQPAGEMDCDMSCVAQFVNSSA